MYSSGFANYGRDGSGGPVRFIANFGERYQSAGVFRTAFLVGRSVVGRIGRLQSRDGPPSVRLGSLYPSTSELLWFAESERGLPIYEQKAFRLI
jgi:hypothetical protein